MLSLTPFIGHILFLYELNITIDSASEMKFGHSLLLAAFDGVLVSC